VHRKQVVHLRSERNVGFGAAVNTALDHVGTPRVVVCNPDTSLDRQHWRALCEGSADEVVAVPLCDGEGRPTSVVNRYPTPLSLVLTAYRLGRFAPRGGRLRAVLTPRLGRWGREHATSMTAVEGVWSLRDHWASGAVVSFDSDRLRSVGGFDDDYFLYFEDVDLCRRLAERHPAMRLRMARTVPAIHTVGGSAIGSARSAAARHRFNSAWRYCRSRRGLRWWLCRMALSPRGAIRLLRPGAV
jgi:GT2 family glycosyltransferase